MGRGRPRKAAVKTTKTSRRPRNAISDKFKLVEALTAKIVTMDFAPGAGKPSAYIGQGGAPRIMVQFMGLKPRSKEMTNVTDDLLEQAIQLANALSTLFAATVLKHYSLENNVIFILEPYETTHNEVILEETQTVENLAEEQAIHADLEAEDD